MFEFTIRWRGRRGRNWSRKGGGGGRGGRGKREEGERKVDDRTEIEEEEAGMRRGLERGDGAIRSSQGEVSSQLWMVDEGVVFGEDEVVAMGGGDAERRAGLVEMREHHKLEPVEMTLDDRRHSDLPRNHPDQ
jgi:hypothetical protein